MSDAMLGKDSFRYTVPFQVWSKFDTDGVNRKNFTIR